MQKREGAPATAGRLGISGSEGMDKPAIKGTLFSAVAADLNRLVEHGRISPEKLESRLEPGDIALLDEKINAAGWYDLFAYHRMVELLCECEGRGRANYWFERGMRAARRLAEAGIYHQMDYLGRTMASGEIDPSARFNAFAKDMRLLLTIHASMLNFGEWRCVADPDHADRYRVEIRGIAGIPDGIFLAAAGMFSGMSEISRSQGTHHWVFERTGEHLAVLRMTGPV
jgi:hypothetical protein